MSMHFISFQPVFTECRPRGQLRVRGCEEEKDAAQCSFQGTGSAAGMTRPHRLMIREQEISPRTKGKTTHSQWQHIQDAGTVCTETRAEGLGGFAFMKTSGGEEGLPAGGQSERHTQQGRLSKVRWLGV